MITGMFFSTNRLDAAVGAVGVSGRHAQVPRLQIETTGEK
jgi:hypothetical protein